MTKIRETFLQLINWGKTDSVADEIEQKISNLHKQAAA